MPSCGSRVNAIGGKSKTVRLSGETAAKQTVNHHDLKPEDYARVQRIFDEGEMFAVGEHHAIAFLEEDDRLWRVVVKTTRDGSEAFLATFHKAQPHNLDAARQRMKRIKRESG